MRPSRESLIVAALCVLDLISTIYLVQNHQAQEGNVVMDFYLQQGIGAFVGAKCMLFVPALVIAEWYRRRNSRLVIRTLRLVIVLYLAFYSAYVFQANKTEILPTAAYAVTTPVVQHPHGTLPGP
jgi:Ca2+/H+ antiporter